jgi:hypothetical protein
MRALDILDIFVRRNPTMGARTRRLLLAGPCDHWRSSTLILLTGTTEEARCRRPCASRDRSELHVAVTVVVVMAR